MHQKHTMALSGNNNLVFTVTLKIAGFSIGFFFYIQDNIP